MTACHILRHTFASHFMMNGGNIRILRDILGHADISMTMRYAHFAPDHMTEAISLNPIASLTATTKKVEVLSPLCRHFVATSFFDVKKEPLKAALNSSYFLLIQP